MISPEEYIEQRLSDQIGWYDRKSGTNQRWFKRLRFAEIIAAATIPFLSGFAGDSFQIKIAIGALGVLVAVVASLLGLLHLQEPLDCVSSHRRVAQKGEIFVSDTNGALR